MARSAASLRTTASHARVICGEEGRPVSEASELFSQCDTLGASIDCLGHSLAGLFGGRLSLSERADRRLPPAGRQMALLLCVYYCGWPIPVIKRPVAMFFNKQTSPPIKCVLLLQDL